MSSWCAKMGPFLRKLSWRVCPEPVLVNDLSVSSDTVHEETEEDRGNSFNPRDRPKAEQASSAEKGALSTHLQRGVRWRRIERLWIETLTKHTSLVEGYTIEMCAWHAIGLGTKHLDLTHT